MNRRGYIWDYFNSPKKEEGMNRNKDSKDGEEQTISKYLKENLPRFCD